ncbi:MAG: GNAT family N-acetyltransferase [Candidatus Eremiobacteraeota bacterium]|nr:GNAT family N-acetyltransferase [Candidatus Eremiobacteraeota bacterium]
MAFTIRRAREGDAEFVVALFLKPQSRAPFYRVDAGTFAGWLERSDLETYVIERDGVPFASLVLRIDPAWQLEISSVAVWESKCGAGRFALQFAIARGFDELGVHRITAEVLSNDARARRLYERLGFRMEGLYREGYRDEGGAYLNVVAYGMLANDRRPAASAR